MATVLTLHPGGKQSPVTVTLRELQRLEAVASAALADLAEVMPVTDWRRPPIVAVARMLEPKAGA